MGVPDSPGKQPPCSTVWEHTRSPKNMPKVTKSYYIYEFDSTAAATPRAKTPPGAHPVPNPPEKELDTVDFRKYGGYEN